MTDTTFKRLDASNWLDPDPGHEAFGEINLATGERREVTGDRWARQILSINLTPEVPREVRDLWEIARGVLLYGWFFYPLYALGDEQLHRVADAAVLFAYRKHGGPEPKGPTTFHRRLAWLFEHGFIDKSLETRWSAIRELRNLGSHVSAVHIAMPMDTLRTLRILAEEIDALFGVPATGT
jgi:hypothetical protein